MNNENNDPRWEEQLTQMLQDYNNKYHVFKDPIDIKKVRCVIEDTRRIRFFEFADDIIKQDVFVADKDLRKRGRPRKHRDISADPPVPKRKRGRPKTVDVEVKEGEKRSSKVSEKYLKERYHSDEDFKEKCKQTSR